MLHCFHLCVCFLFWWNNISMTFMAGSLSLIIYSSYLVVCGCLCNSSVVYSICRVFVRIGHDTQSRGLPKSWPTRVMNSVGGELGDVVRQSSAELWFLSSSQLQTRASNPRVLLAPTSSIVFVEVVCTLIEQVPVAYLYAIWLLMGRRHLTGFGVWGCGSMSLWWSYSTVSSFIQHDNSQYTIIILLYQILF